jgi:hypothetical protein
MKPISNGMEPMLACSRKPGQGHGDHVGHVAEVEVGDELADHQQHEDQSGQPGERLGDGGDDLVGGRHRLGPAAVGDAGQAGRG